MKIDDAIEAITRFFNDLIGILVPATVLVLGLGIMHLGPSKLGDMSKHLDEGAIGALVLAALFAIGHGLSAIHSTLLNQALILLRITKGFDRSGSASRTSYLTFDNIVAARIDKELGASSGIPNSWDYNDLRNVALSVSSEASSIARRFMFISLLCNGVGTALILIAADFALCTFLFPFALYPYDRALPDLLQLALLLGLSTTFFYRGTEFRDRAMTSPFSVAIAEVVFRSAPAPKIP